MTREEFDGWRAVTEASRFQWTEDPISRLNNKGAMYYIGGEDGCYIDISKDGKVTVGTYEGAYPHIGEAAFYVKGTRQLKDFNEAFEYAIKLGGKKFLVDMFSGDAPAQPIVAAPEEPPSVIEKIRQAQKAPKPSRKATDNSKTKNKEGAEL